MPPIRNSRELQDAIGQLRIDAKNQRTLLKEKISCSKITVESFSLLFPHIANLHWRQWIKPAIRIFPAVATKLFLKRSSFIVKSLLGLAGQLGSKSI